MIEFYGTGRRKKSTARVHLRPGTGTIRINGRTFEDFFPNDVLKMVIRQPLVMTELDGKFDIVATVDGGGASGQAGAVRHGIARALLIYNGELRKKLKKADFLRRDPRAKERKKYGQRGARARFQFSKR